MEECHSIMSECWLSCDTDAICRYECSVNGDQCIDSCPCFSDCPAGCDKCSNSICACFTLDQNLDYLICSKWADSIYLKCIAGCQHGDAECLSNCARDYNILIEQCPCKVRVLINLFETKIEVKSGCPDGCPCEVYSCPETTMSMTTTSTRTSVVHFG